MRKRTGGGKKSPFFYREYCTAGGPALGSTYRLHLTYCSGGRCGKGDEAGLRRSNLSWRLLLTQKDHAAHMTVADRRCASLCTNGPPRAPAAQGATWRGSGERRRDRQCRAPRCRPRVVARRGTARRVRRQPGSPLAPQPPRTGREPTTSTPLGVPFQDCSAGGCCVMAPPPVASSSASHHSASTSLARSHLPSQRASPGLPPPPPPPRSTSQGLGTTLFMA